MKYRQVHLDFHTSEHIMDIGTEFNKKQFQKMLEIGHVDSVTLFSKCHHGWSYHPTNVNEMHPGLSFDLLGEQLEACKEIDISTNIYVSAGLDEKEAIRHPEWLVRTTDEKNPWTEDFIHSAGFHLLCYNTQYLDLLKNQIIEIMENYNPTGIFLDISSVHLCYCARCRQDIINRGKDPENINASMEQAELVYKKYIKCVQDVIHKYNKKCTIFHNGGHIVRGRRDLVNYNTHLELESLPTGGWGYNHFPMSASYVANFKMDYLGMTGKFHNTWGEFGGYKHPNSLRYETALSLAFGAKCSIGDQLHPLGKMNEGTYAIMGIAYAEVKEKEEWCKEAINCYDIGILSDEAVNSNTSNRDVQRYGDIGANRIMLECNYLYRFIDTDENFNNFKLIILPDTIRLSEELSKKLQVYIQGGGKVLASGTSGLRKGKDVFTIDFGVNFLGESSSKPDYLIPDFPCVSGQEAHIMYGTSYIIEQTGGKVFGKKQNSYFNRNIRHFCSHQHAPNDKRKSLPSAVITKNTAYISWNVFKDYGRMGSLHLKEMIKYAVDTLLCENKTIEIQLVDKAIVTLTKQAKCKRYINHIVFAHTTNRGKFLFEGIERPIEVIEDIVPLYEISVQIHLKEVVKNVYLAPQMNKIPFKNIKNGIEYIIPKVNCHQMIIIDV